MKEVNFIILKDPFSKTNREIRQADFTGEPVFNYIKPLDTDIVISRNGIIIPQDEYGSLIPKPGDSIIICPVISGSAEGKDMARTLAGIAVMAGAMATGNWIAAGAAWGFWSYAAAAAVNVVGGYLVNQLFPIQEDNDKTYGWGQPYAIGRDGEAIPISFGTIRMGVMCPAQILSQHITTNGDKQYLNILFSGGDGPCDYNSTGEESYSSSAQPDPLVVSGISNILLNNNPLKNFKDVQVFLRAGLNNQSVIPNFGDTYAEQYLSYDLELGADWSTQVTEGDGGAGLEVTIDFPNGLYYTCDDGSIGETAVKIQMQYKNILDAGWKDWTYPIIGMGFSDDHVCVTVDGDSVRDHTSDYTKMFAEGKEVNVFDTFFTYISTTHVLRNSYQQSTYNGISKYRTSIVLSGSIPENIGGIQLAEAGTFVIFERSNKPVRKVYRLNNLPQGQYEVRVKCIEKDGTSTRYINDAHWTGLSHIIYDDFQRPNKILVGIRALATDQLSGGMPKITWDQTRSYVWVWNPNTESYEQKPADNPAWASYEVMHYCRRYENTHTHEWEFVVKGIPAEQIIYQEFADWAEFCESKGLKYNGIIYKIARKMDAIKPIEIAGRGKVMPKGTKIGCICDRAMTPTQMFNVANIEVDSFSEEFAGKLDRANALEIVFYNIENNYQRMTFPVYGDDYSESDAISNPTQMVFECAMTPAQAYREGKYYLRYNQYIKRAISIKVDIDAIACNAGDVILVQHDIPQWGTGGRIVSATINTVTLDRPVFMFAGKSYQISIRLLDDTIIIKDVQTQVGEQTTVSVLSNFDIIPAQYDLFNFGETNIYAKPFRVISFSRSGDLRKQIRALEYIEAVNEEATDIPIISYSSPDNKITNLVISQHTDIYRVYWVDVKWSAPRQMYGGASITVDGIQVGNVDKSGNQFSFQINDVRDYVITVTAVDDFGKYLDDETQIYTVIDANLPPAAPSGLDFDWNTPDLKIFWSTVSMDRDGVVIPNIRDYKVEIYSGSTLIYTDESVESNLFIYDFAQNILNNAPNGATSLIAKVYARDLDDRYSDATQIACTCPVPTAPTLATPTVSIGQLTITVGLTIIQSQKFAKCQIKASQTNNFNPDSVGTLIHDNPGTVYPHAVDTGSTWYYRARIIDKFGQISTWSSQVSGVADKIDETDFYVQVLRRETITYLNADGTGTYNPTSGTLDNLSDGSWVTGVTFAGAGFIQVNFKIEQIYETIRLIVGSNVNFYSQYFDESTQSWKDCSGNASSPKTATPPNGNVPYVAQITPCVPAKKMRIKLLGAATIYELRFSTYGEFDSLRFHKATGDMVELGALRIGQQVQAAPLPLTINPITDLLCHYDYNFNSTQGDAPLDGVIATLRPGEGRFNGTVAVEEGTTNLLTDGDCEANVPKLNNNSSSVGATSVLSTDQKHDGAKSLKITTSATSTIDRYYQLGSYSLNGLTPGQTDSFAVYVYIQSSSGIALNNVFLRIFHKVGGAYSSTNGTTPLAYDSWQRITVTKTLDATATEAFLRLQINQDVQNVSIYTDDFILERKPYSTSMCIGTRAAGQLSYSQPLNKNEGTLSVWINPEYVADYNNFFSMTLSTGRFLLFFGATGASHWDFGVINSGPNAPAGTVAVGRYDMHTLTWSITSGKYIYYVNGQLIGSRDYIAPDSLPTALPTVINYGALLDELYILKRAATADEIAMWYNFGAPFTDPLEILPDSRISSSEAWAETSTNFNVRNDRNNVIPADPVVSVDGTAIDHTINTDGSADISFEWTYAGTGDAYDIDGFILYMYASSNSSAYNFGSPANEMTMFVAADKRAFIARGVAANLYYTFGIQAYRDVDQDINATGTLKSGIIKSTRSDENPYRPSASVAFAGNITGTVSGTAAAVVVSNALMGSAAYDGTVNYRTPGAPTRSPVPTGITVTQNPNGTINIRVSWAKYTQGTIKADFLFLFWKSGPAANQGSVNLTDARVTLSVNELGSSYYDFEGVPPEFYSFGITAGRPTDLGIEICTIQCPTSSPDWQDVDASSASFNAGIVPVTAGNIYFDSLGQINYAIGSDGVERPVYYQDIEGNQRWYNKDNGYLMFQVSNRGEFKDKDGYLIIDVNGRFTGRIIQSGTCGSDIGGNNYTEYNFTNVTVPPGKKWVGTATPSERTAFAISDNTKTLKCINDQEIIVSVRFYDGIAWSSLLPAGTYSNVTIRINHHTIINYGYTDGSNSGYQYIHFPVNYQITEILV